MYYLSIEYFSEERKKHYKIAVRGDIKSSNVCSPILRQSSYSSETPISEAMGQRCKSSKLILHSLNATLKGFFI